MHPSVIEELIRKTDATAILEIEVVQSLWSGFGAIERVYLEGGNQTSVIIKRIQVPEKMEHPRGWGSRVSVERKIKSYEIERHWYEAYAEQLSDEVRVPQLLFTCTFDDISYIVLEDLYAVGYSKRYQGDSLSAVKTVVAWLAQFHALFLNVEPTGLWRKGTYWHLDTRKEEWEAMESGGLKKAAKEIDYRLNQCKYQTLVHGDAKLANFCFNADYSKVAAVDFQYVGGGCGMKDVIYLMSSALAEQELFILEGQILDAYFESLRSALVRYGMQLDNFKALQDEWMEMYVLAWADFARFLKGWSPKSSRCNRYVSICIQKTLLRLNRI